ncbi:MAG: ATP-binding protein [Deltaproteobacteria bacterium]|nr:ATP-binding protein [Deltaproteobacteria bacterium]
MKQYFIEMIIYYLQRLLAGPLPFAAMEQIFNWFKNYHEYLLDTDYTDLYNKFAGEDGDLKSVKKNSWLSKYSREENCEQLFPFIRFLICEHFNKIVEPENNIIIEELNKICSIFNFNDKEREIIKFIISLKSIPYFEVLTSKFDIHLLSSCINYKNLENFALFVGLKANEISQILNYNSDLINKGIFRVDKDRESFMLTSLSDIVLTALRTGESDIKSLVLGGKVQPNLERSDFGHLTEDFDFLANLLERATAAKMPGINLLLYGAPGTGKTEFAKTLASAAGADLYSVSERELSNNRSARLDNLKMAKIMVKNDPKSVLLFDEASDVFDYSVSDKYSKLYLNKMLETNEAPVIWITNHVRNIDSAFLRRFSYALELKIPPPEVRAKMWRDELAKNDLTLGDAEIRELSRTYETPPAYMTSSVKAGKIVGDPSVVKRTLDSLEMAISGIIKQAEREEINFNLELVNVNMDLSVLTEKILSKGLKHFSLCLYGAPGTGKSEYVRYLAKKMDLTVMHLRASDLMDCYVGGTEQNIARAFKQAREQRKFLIFDEADSFLGDRKRAVRNWEISHVNEMLTWMETHPWPFACTTNLMDRLDAASLRRFTFKVKFGYLTPEMIAAAFEHFFGFRRSISLSRLTPADFALAAKKASILGLEDPSEIAALLTEECKAKGEESSTIRGFCG